MHDVIRTTAAPSAIGPYSQGIKAKVGQMLFMSGQIPLNPMSGEVVGQDIEEQTRQVLQNMQAILREANADFSHVVKTTIFLVDMNDFAKVNAIYAAAFSQNPPARSTVQVSRLPKDVKIEIEAIAVF